MSGAELREKRRALRLTQQQLAEALGVEKNTVARWERGELRPQSPRMLRLALIGLEQERLAELIAEGGLEDVQPRTVRAIAGRVRLLMQTRAELQALVTEKLSA